MSDYQSLISLQDFATNNNYDYIKQMYEAIIPKELRHALGEYYTPDWLAEETLNQATSFDGDIAKSIYLDPTCGSGTFLFKTILEKKKISLFIGTNHKICVWNRYQPPCGFDCKNKLSFINYRLDENGYRTGNPNI